MKKRRLKPFAVPVLYLLSLTMIIASVYFVEEAINGKMFKSENVEDVQDSTEEVVEEVPSNDMPVVNTEPQIIRPYVNESIKVVRNFYNKDADNNTQENSIIYYGDTYMQNSGIDYAGEGEFEVVSILDGTITEIKDDEIMGKTVKIQHNNELISVYQSMGTVNFKVNDTVGQGAIIGTSGENNIGKDLGSHLHFELYYKGKIVNPDEYFGKLISQLG